MPSETAGWPAAILAIHKSPSRIKTVYSILHHSRILFHAAESALLLPIPHVHALEVFRCQAAAPRRLLRARITQPASLEWAVHKAGKPLWHSLPRGPEHEVSSNPLTSRSFMAVPLDLPPGARAMLMLMDSQRPHRFTASRLQALRVFAQQAAAALHKVRALEAQRAFNAELRRQVQSATTQLRGANESLRQADLAKSELMSMVAHELRTPITSISGFAKLLLKQKAGPLNEEQLQFSEIIHKNSANLERMITDLLDITKIELGRLDMRMGSLSLTSLAKEALMTLRGGLPGHDQRFECRLDGGPCMVHGDRMRLLQVMHNLLSNAVKYSPAGSPIHLSVSPGGEDITFAVRNLGHVLTPEQRTKVFDKFYRLKSPGTQGAPGSGLGLAIAKSIIQAHHGRIWAESSEAEGNTFFLSLPKAQAHHADAGAGEQQTVPNPTQ